MSLRQFFLGRYKEYTEIQKIAMPIIAGGSNCLVIAPTGAGKTEAAALPVLEKIEGDKDRSGIRLVYITPLRALNRDMVKRLEELCREAGISIGVRHGDTTQSERSRQARSAPQVLITTPETLQSILPTKTIGLALKNVRAVVIDEIHELYHNKRGAQLSIALERLERIAPNFQRIGISATVGNVDVVKGFLCNRRECRIARVEKLKGIEIKVELPRGYESRLKPMMGKFGLDADALARLNSIARHIARSRSTLIFSNTRQIVEALGSRLVYLDKMEGFGGIGVHHSSLDREERVAIENAFRNGMIKSIIATSSLELGIDIGKIDLVVQYGSPRQALRLAQRVGRSGHTQLGVSRGVVIATNPLEALEAVSVYRNLSEGRLESFRPQFRALDVLANQICGVALDTGSIGKEALLGLIKGSYIYKELSEEEMVELLGFMTKQRMVGFDGKTITSGPRTRMYYYDHLSAIPDTKRFVVKNIAQNRIISTLDERFVANNLDENATFITKGLPWKVVSIDKDVISVEPSMELEAAVPDWSGEDIPVSREVSLCVFDLFSNPDIITKGGCTDGETGNQMMEFIDKQNRSFIPSRSKIFVEEADEYKVLHTGLGTLANEALSRLLASMLSMRLGMSVNIKSSPYLIFIEVRRSTDVVHVLEGLSPDSIVRTLEEAVASTEIFRYRFITVAKLFGLIDKDAVLSKSIAKRLMKVMAGTPVEREAIRELMHNYFDTEALRHFAEELQSRRLKVERIGLAESSPLTRAVLSSAYYTKELITPLTPNNELVESFSKFILAKEIKLICTYCGFNFTRELSEIKDSERIECPSCSSPMISLYDETFPKVIERRRAGKRLGAQDQAMLREMLKYAGLFRSYGGKAAVALSVYGIGHRTAARTLMMLKHDERSFFIDLIEAQKTFIRTKKYWSI